MRWILSVCLLSLLLWASSAPLGCGSAHVPAEAVDPAGEAFTAPAEPEPPPPPPDRFSAARAFADLGALVSIGPRISGTEGAAAARDYLREQLSRAGLEVEEIAVPREAAPTADATDAAPDAAPPPPPLRHLSVTLPGSSPARFVLLASYDTRRIPGVEFVGANDGASSAALLLELARVLSHRELPYTTQLLFLDGEGGAEPEGGAPGQARWRGSQGLARWMAGSGELDAVRLLVAFHQVCDADLRIARDLSSHRMYREEFFRAADRVGRAGAFPRDQGFESVEAGHLAFRAQGVRGAVAITDTRYGGDAAPGLYAGTAADTIEHCSPESLEAVGVVTLEALATIGTRLAKIDRFARSPVTESEAMASEEAPSEDGASPQEEPAGEDAQPQPGATPPQEEPPQPDATPPQEEQPQPDAMPPQEEPPQPDAMPPQEPAS